MVITVEENLLKAVKHLCCPHIETSQLICTANQLTGFYMRATKHKNILVLICEILCSLSRL